MLENKDKMCKNHFKKKKWAEFDKNTYITNTPCNLAFFAWSGRLICLTFNAQVHDMITANSTIINGDIYKGKDIVIRL